VSGGAAEPKTNVEFVTDLMEYNRFGAMAQLVILEAIERYVDGVIDNEADVLKGMEGTMIHGPAWVGTCKEIKRKLEERRGSDKPERSEEHRGGEEAAPANAG
jgi:hypothetical protein